MESKKILICLETNKKTNIYLNPDDPWEHDKILQKAANRLLKREPEHGPRQNDFVCIGLNNLRSEIFHGLTDLTEHTGKYRNFKIINS